MIETIFLVWLILCVVVFYVLLSVIRKLYEKRLDTEVNYISDRYRDRYNEEIQALKKNNRKHEEMGLRREKYILELENKLHEAEKWHIGHSDEGERVFVCSVTRSGEKRINIAYYKDGKWHGNGNLDNVIAWRPLPELPEFEDPAEGGANER